jgi:diaminohydroxyphosphoribosylaminopyrimidine deaminase / 5-amino-6-(5-phosphoribosylamino)uracil reductase
VAQPASPDLDRHWLALAVDLAGRCVPSPTAFSVGAVLITADGNLLATGFSRETDPADHAEEIALIKAAAAGGRPLLRGATMYSSLEPCAVRSSRPTPCADLIIESGVGRAVIAWLEPPIFVPGGGAVLLREAGVTVNVLPEFATAARAVNAHLLQVLHFALRGRSRGGAARCPPGLSDAETWQTRSVRSCA